MSKIIAMLITVSTLFLPSIIQAKPISIKVAYENNPGEPLDVVMRYWADLLNKKSNGCHRASHDGHECHNLE